MPSSKKGEALVFSRKNMGEADRLITFFTRDRGLVRAIAKGVRKIPSSRGGHLEPLTKVAAIFHESRSGTYVGAVETEEYYKDLHGDHDAVARIKRIISIFMKFFDTEQSVPALFDSFCASFQLLPRLSVEKRRLVESSLYLRIMQVAGVLPDLSGCVVCGKSKPEHDIVLSFEEGAWRCRACTGFFIGGYAMSSREFSVFRYIAVRPEHASRIAASQEEALRVEEAVRSLVVY